MTSFIVKEFINTFDFLKFISEEIKLDSHLVFRGQPSNKFKIVSSFERHVSNKNFEPEKKLIYYNELIKTFKSRCIKEGFITENELNTKAELESFCQHYGLPTRLIDWSYSPYVALFFAYQGNIRSEIESDKVSIFILYEYKHVKSVILDENPSCVAFDDSKIINRMGEGNIESFYSYKIEKMSNINKRIRAQSGCFYTIPTFYENFEEYAENLAYKNPWILRCDLPTNERLNVLRHLDLMGINLGALYLDASGVAIDTLFSIDR